MLVTLFPFSVYILSDVCACVWSVAPACECPMPAVVGCVLAHWMALTALFKSLAVAVWTSVFADFSATLLLCPRLWDMGSLTFFFFFKLGIFLLSLNSSLDFAYDTKCEVPRQLSFPAQTLIAAGSRGQSYQTQALFL